MAEAMLQQDWTDKRRYLWLLSTLTMLLPLGAIGLVNLTGHPVFWWFGPLFVFVVIPILDVMLGEETENPPESVVPRLEQERYYRIAVWIAVAFQYWAFLVAVQVIATASLPWYSYLGLAITTGTAMGIAINTAHELGHKTNDFERWLAKLALAPVFYGHFFVEHNRGHHVRVSTPEDPASSRFGESFYRFLPRTVFGSLRSAWELEAKRLEKEGKSVWHIDNHNLQAWGLSVLLWGGLLVMWGWVVLPFLLIQSVFGFQLLEVVNYLEHYGLLRQKKDNRRYEPCRPEHSWNSNRRVTNIFLYQLQRHSDHHAYPTRSYQSLRHFDEAPQLPGGYASMIVLAWIPPLWFRVMDKRVIAHYKGDMERINMA
ncbi:MAG: alkane 1-monooxygenase [Alcanivorax sp.]|nr:alkane 1-monooxygenase [Alcanivorax sp.]